MFVLGESEDEALHELMVVSVVPAPDAGRLLVSVIPVDGKIDLPHTLARLQAARGWLRSEIAASIHRRKAPDLLFHVQDASESAGDSL
jgi:ribosome-binding factor A